MMVVLLSGMDTSYRINRNNDLILLSPKVQAGLLRISYL